MTTARQEVLVQGEVGIYHCISRCVRRAWLCGDDPLSGTNYDHRKEWVRSRIKMLSGLFAVEVCGYAVMSNHLHLVLRTRPDRCCRWPAEEVAERWCNIFPRHGVDATESAHLQAAAINAIVADGPRLAEIRERLSSISWFMRCLNEWIARRANGEDGCTGRFWEGRFKCQALLDDAAVLACMAYVDLNPVRAGMVKRLEKADYTSVHDRIMARQHGKVLTALKAEGKSKKSKDNTVLKERSRCADWLASFEGRDGFLPLTLDQYLDLLDWSGRQIARGKQGKIPDDLVPLLERLDVDSEHWLAAIQGYGRWWHLVVGTLQDMAARAARCGRHWLQGRGPSGFSFSPG